MAKENNLTDFLTDVASAIKDKRGIGSVNAQDFSTEIRAIEPLLDTINITENGKHDVKDYKSVSVAVENQDYIQIKNYFEHSSTSSTPSFDISYGVTAIKKYIDATLYIPNSVTTITDSVLRSNARFKGTFNEWLEIEKGSKNGGICNKSGEYLYLTLIKDGKSVALTSSDIEEGNQYINTKSEIKKGAFSDLDLKNTNLYFSNNIKSIPNYAFFNCRNVNKIEFELGDFVEFGKNVFRLIQGGTNSTIILPKIKTLVAGAFYGTTIKNLVMQEGLEDIEGYTFSDVANTNFNLPNSLLYIRKNAFINANLNTSKTIVLPPNLISIEGSAFNRVNTFYVRSTTPFNIESNSLGSVSTITAIYVPKGTSEAFKSATNWSYYASKIKEEYSIVLNVQNELLNNPNVKYSLDGGNTYQMFTNGVLSLQEVAVVKIKSTDSSQTILIGTTEGGNDIGTIANSELTFSFSGDTTIYLTIQ